MLGANLVISTILFNLPSERKLKTQKEKIKITIRLVEKSLVRAGIGFPAREWFGNSNSRTNLKSKIIYHLFASHTNFEF